MPFLDLSSRMDSDAAEPLSLQLARLLAAEILGGHLAPGEALPSSRSLAQDLGLSRHLVMSALWELQMEGWVESRQGSGTFVADHPPSIFPRAWGKGPELSLIPEHPAFDLPSQLRPVSTLAATMLDLSEGCPDARLAPKEALAKGYRRAMQRHGDNLLGRGESRGNQTLREQLASHLQHARGLRAEAGNLLITRGTPMSLTLIAQALAAEGGHIAVEDPGNPEAWEALRSSRATLHPVPVDARGLIPEALEALAKSCSLALVYLSPRRHFPTTVPLEASRREAVMALARRHGFALVEDDPDAELGWEGPQSLPMAARDPEGQVIHLGSLSQLLAPSLGLAYLVGPAALVDRLARLRRRMDVQGDRVLEWAVADLIRDGDWERHLARSRRVLRQRREAFVQGVNEVLGEGFEVTPCGGGQACWVRIPADLDMAAWATACLGAGVRILPGSHHDFHGRELAGLRLGFAHLEPVEARQALGILRQERERLTGKGHG